MVTQEWPANEYAIGSYIQATVADHYLNKLKLKPSDSVLDIGCGNGSYTKKILDMVPQGSVVGVDASSNMLELAQQLTTNYPGFSVYRSDVLDLNYANQFDAVVSFWCLQWTREIKKAFENIHSALKKNGTVFVILPFGNDPYILSYYALKESGAFHFLTDFRPSMDYSLIDNLSERLASIPFEELKVEQFNQKIILPSLDVYRKFVNGIAFYQGKISDQEIRVINEAMVQYFADECNSKYNGEYQFNFTIYLVTGRK